MLAKLGKTYNYALRAAIIVLTVYFLYDQIFYRRDLQSVLDYFPRMAADSRFVLFLSLTFLLLPLNLALETVKWRYLVNRLEPVSFRTAFKAVLAGISVSMFFPNRVGDYLGRVFVLRSADRLQAVLVTVLGSMAQLLTTILFGIFAFLFFFLHYFTLSTGFERWMFSGLVLLVILLAFSLVFVYLNFSVFSEILKRISGRAYRKIEKYAEVFAWYLPSDLLKILGISVARYLVFSFQFWLLMRAFQLQLSYPTAMMLIALIYLLMTIIPTVALTEIGVRGSVSVFVFGFYFGIKGVLPADMEVAVASASTVLWLINLAFPALLGIVPVATLRFIRNGNGHGS